MMRVICQFKILTIIVLSLFVLSSKGQVYQSMPQYGYSGPRFNMDSTLSIPTVCGVPTLKSNLTKKAAIAFDSCNGVFYQYNPKTLAWSQITGGGGSTDTTSLSNRINQKLNISDTANMLIPYLRKIDTTNKFVSSVTKLNDSTIRVIKGSTTTDITLTPTITVTAATRLVTTVYNNSGATIAKGSVIYINGRHSSNYPTIAKAQANTEDNSYSTFALVQDDITNNSTGTVIQAGNISNLNLPTATYTDGQIVYLSPTVAGGITTTKPLAPYHIVKIGTVTRAHPTQGSIELKIENGWQLDELSDVSIAVVPADYSVLQFRRTDSLWHDITLSNVIGTKVDTIYRTGGKDSIIFTINNVRYAIRDSISTLRADGNTTGSILYNTYGTAYGNDSLRYNENLNTFYIDAALNINASKGAGTLKGIKIDNLPERNSYNHVLAYDISTGIVGYKSSTTSVGGAVNSIQFRNNVNGFSGDTGFVYTNNGETPTNRVGIGTSSPQNKLDVAIGKYVGGMNRGFYETASFSRNDDNKVGIYNAGNYNGTGSSITFGNIKNKNSLGYYPGFEFQNSNDSATPGNSVMRYNYLQRDSTGQVLQAVTNLMDVNANGTIKINGADYYTGITVAPRLVIGDNDNGTALEVINVNDYRVATFQSGLGHPLQIITVDDNADAGWFATKGAILNCPNGLYENIDGDYKYRKLSRPYRSYVAQLSQAGSYAPTANILENDFGYEPTWSRTSQGLYTLSSTELTAENWNKVVVFYNLGNYPSQEWVDGSAIFSNCKWSKEEGFVVLYTGKKYFCPDGTTNCQTHFDYTLEDDILSDADDYFPANIEIRIYD